MKKNRRRHQASSSAAWSIVGGAAVAASAVAGTAAGIAWSEGEASAATTSNLTILGLYGGDQISNYDFNSTSYSSRNVDWPVTFMFTDNAEVDKVKDALDYLGYPYAGGVKYARQKDGASLAWDSDRGLKNATGNCATTYHMRLYADPNDDRGYNLLDGYYVFGTTHRDINENCDGELFGYSEYAEDKFVDELETKYAVSEDCCGFYNLEAYRAEGNHIWQNNGYASYVEVP